MEEKKKTVGAGRPLSGGVKGKTEVQKSRVMPAGKMVNPQNMSMYEKFVNLGLAGSPERVPSSLQYPSSKAGITHMQGHS